MSKEYRNQWWLSKKYVDENMNVDEIAEICGASYSTIYHWLDKFGVEKSWRDEGTLRFLYCNRSLSSTEVARRLGTTDTTVLRWLRKNDIDVVTAKQDRPVPYRLTNNIERRQNCYMVFTHMATETVLEHRLLATLLVDEISELEGKDVHHENEIPWDNRLSNIRVMDSEEHGRMHAKDTELWKHSPDWEAEASD